MISRCLHFVDCFKTSCRCVWNVVRFNWWLTAHLEHLQSKHNYTGTDSVTQCTNQIEKTTMMIAIGIARSRVVLTRALVGCLCVRKRKRDRENNEWKWYCCCCCFVSVDRLIATFEFLFLQANWYSKWYNISI